MVSGRGVPARYYRNTPFTDMTRNRIDPDGEARPQLETVVSKGYFGVVIREAETDVSDGKYIPAEHPVEARP